MSGSQANLLVDDLNEEVTQPGGSCLPTKLLTFEESQALGSISDSERYYQELSNALDEALNLSNR